MGENHVQNSWTGGGGTFNVMTSLEASGRSSCFHLPRLQSVWSMGSSRFCHRVAQGMSGSSSVSTTFLHGMTSSPRMTIYLEMLFGGAFVPLCLGQWRSITHSDGQWRIQKEIAGGSEQTEQNYNPLSYLLVQCQSFPWECVQESLACGGVLFFLFQITVSKSHVLVIFSC